MPLHSTYNAGATFLELGVSFRAVAFAVSIFFMSLSWGGASTASSLSLWVVVCGAVTVHMMVPMTPEMGRAVGLLKATNVFSSDDYKCGACQCFISSETLLRDICSQHIPVIIPLRL